MAVGKTRKIAGRKFFRKAGRTPFGHFLEPVGKKYGPTARFLPAFCPLFLTFFEEKNTLLPGAWSKIGQKPTFLFNYYDKKNKYIKKN